MARLPEQFRSTPKQWGYFRALTGQSLPSGCSKKEASRLIDLAKRGEWKPKPRNVAVCAYRVVDWEKTGPVTYEVQVDYMPCAPRWDNQAAAIAYAEALLRDGETVDVGRGVRDILVD